MNAVRRPRHPAARGAAAIALTWLMLAPAAAHANPSIPDPELTHAFGDTTQHVLNTPTRNVFAEQKVIVEVPYEAVEDPQPKSASTRIGRWIRTRLVQRTSGITKEVGRPRELLVSRGPSAGRAQIEVDLPPVGRETLFELMVESRAAAGDWRPAQPITIRAFPKDLLVPLRTMAGKRRIRVVEDRGAPRLARFLSRVDIDFESPGATPKRGAGPPITLYAGEAAQADPSTHDEPGAAIYFTEHEATIPHVVVERGASGKGPTLTVAMPLLDRIETDPAAQQTFLQLFELLEANREGT